MSYRGLSLLGKMFPLIKFFNGIKRGFGKLFHENHPISENSLPLLLILPDFQIFVYW